MGKTTCKPLRTRDFLRLSGETVARNRVLVCKSNILKY